MGMLSHGPDFRPEVPENLDSLPGGTFEGIHHYIQLMRDCWAEVRIHYIPPVLLALTVQPKSPVLWLKGGPIKQACLRLVTIFMTHQRFDFSVEKAAPQQILQSRSVVLW